MRETLESRLRAIQLEFVQNLPGRIDELVRALDQDLPPAVQLQQARQLAHRLAGGAGTLGQPQVSAAAKALELDLQAWVESGREADPDTLAGFRNRSLALLQSIQDPV